MTSARAFAICAAASIGQLCAVLWWFARWTGYDRDMAPPWVRTGDVVLALSLAVASHVVPWVVRRRSAHRRRHAREQAARRAAAWGVALGAAIVFIGYEHAYGSVHYWLGKPSLWDFEGYFVASWLVVASQLLWPLTCARRTCTH